MLVGVRAVEWQPIHIFTICKLSGSFAVAPIALSGGG